MTYAEKLKDPRWQKRRLEILNRDQWTCQKCKDKDSTLHVHHRYYVFGCEPWEVPDEALVTVCFVCHEEEEGIAKEAKSKLLTVFLNAGFFYTDIQEPFSLLLEDALKALGKDDFDFLITRIALSKQLRSDVIDLIQKERKYLIERTSASDTNVDVK